MMSEKLLKEIGWLLLQEAKHKLEMKHLFVSSSNNLGWEEIKSTSCLKRMLKMMMILLKGLFW